MILFQNAGKKPGEHRRLICAVCRCHYTNIFNPDGVSFFRFPRDEIRYLIYLVSQKKLTLLNSLPNKKCEVFLENLHIICGQFQRNGHDIQTNFHCLKQSRIKIQVWTHI